MGRPHRRRLAPTHSRTALRTVLPRAERRARGIYYTPPEIVRQLVRLTLENYSAGKRGSHSAAAPHPRSRLRRGSHADAAAQAQLPRRRLASSSSAPTSIPRPSAWLGPPLPTARLVLRRRPVRRPLGQAGPRSTRSSAIRPMSTSANCAKCQPAEYLGQLRQRFRTARGNFDLYAPFVERAWELLAPGGRCGLIVPNKWATLDYARPLRELLLARSHDRARRRFVGASASSPRPASIRTSWSSRNSRRPASHAVQYHVSELSSGCCRSGCSRQRRSASPPSLDCRIPRRRPGRSASWQPLLRHARLFGPARGSGATRLGRARLLPSRLAAKALDFITSGNIDRYAIRRATSGSSAARTSSPSCRWIARHSPTGSGGCLPARKS